MSKVIVTITHVIPLVDYGNTTISCTQEIDISEGDGLQLWAESAIEEVRVSLAGVILPLVESEVERCAEVLLKDHSPDNWMRRNSKVYNWFRLAYPEVEIQAMQAIAMSKSVPNSAQE